MTTSTPQLLVWLEQRTNTVGARISSGGDVFAYLADGSNFVSGAQTGLARYPGMPLVYPLHFSIFPRRDRDLALSIFHRDSKNVVTQCCSLAFANPVYQTLPQWQSETLPATKHTGDLEVTLQGLETGHNGNSGSDRRPDGSITIHYGTDRHDGENYTAVHLKFHPLENTNEIWQVAGVEASDATSNSAHNSGMNSSYSTLAFSPSLWPGEAAWKLKLELKRTGGFRPEEKIVFKNVPLGELDHTNGVAWTTNVNGLSVTLQYILRRAPNTNSFWSSSNISTVHITVSGLPGGSQFDLMGVVCDTGKTNHIDGWSDNGGQRDYHLSDIPLAAQTADFLCVLQQTRMVEFTVKPELPETNSEIKK